MADLNLIIKISLGIFLTSALIILLQLGRFTMDLQNELRKDCRLSQNFVNEWRKNLVVMSIFSVIMAAFGVIIIVYG